MKSFNACVATLLLMAVGVQANAVTVDPATGSVSVNGQDGALTDPSMARIDGAAASLARFPAVLLTAQALSPALGKEGNASGNFTYYFTVVGGSPGDVVPVLIAAKVLTLAINPDGGTDDADGFVSLTVNGAQQKAICIGQSGCSGSQFDGSIPVSAVSGSEVQVGLELEALASTFTGGSAFASVRPSKKASTTR